MEKIRQNDSGSNMEVVTRIRGVIPNCGVENVGDAFESVHGRPSKAPLDE